MDKNPAFTDPHGPWLNRYLLPLVAIVALVVIALSQPPDWVVGLIVVAAAIAAYVVLPGTIGMLRDRNGGPEVSKAAERGVTTRGVWLAVACIPVMFISPAMILPAWIVVAIHCSRRWPQHVTKDSISAAVHAGVNRAASDAGGSPAPRVLSYRWRRSTDVNGEIALQRHDGALAVAQFRYNWLHALRGRPAMVTPYISDTESARKWIGDYLPQAWNESFNISE